VAERPEAARIALPRSPSSVSTARRFIAARTAAWSFPEPAADRLVLIGSELVTNAVLHARTELTLTLELREDRVRISVMDRSRTPATMRHYRPDALTGRGLGVVAALSDRWGVSTAPDGKVVWAELQANGDSPGPGDPAPADPPAAPPAPPADIAGSRPVRFPGVPVDGYLDLQAHNDALFRELELISIELEGDNAAEVAAPLADLVDQLYRRFRGQRDSYRDHVAVAKAAGRPTVELATTATAAAVAAAHGYLALLEQADDLCRAGVLLTPEPSPAVQALRRWFVDQMAAQVLHNATPTPPPG
jgi:anti-sigma regulatory factor (Ser/Thr protein kinase)